MALSLGRYWGASLSLRLGRVSSRKGGGRRSDVEGNGGGTWALRAASVEYRGRLGKWISGSVSVSATASRAGRSLDQEQGTDRQTGRVGWCNTGYKDAISERCMCCVFAGRM